ncbi:MAG: hypothetical protein C3F15_15790 [Holophagae bacterium]|nr:MAG: hypothetical protein C3F15_15790 [Holophagae bacterium]
MVDQLAEEYADDPVVFIEYDVDNPAGNRVSRWWAAWGSGGSVYLPLIMVDSGNQISNGSVAFAQRYRAMVDAALQRPAAARLEVNRERVGNSFRFDIALTNLSGVTLSSANSATLHVIVYEEAHVGDTDRWVRAATAQSISNLAPGGTGAFTAEIAPQGVVDWDKVHSVVIADYRPGGATGAYDMLQAVHQ